MNRDLTAYRKSYEKSFLEESDLPETPILLFSQWFKEVEEKGGVEETNAMTITTTGSDGFPKARIVLLKHFDDKGFVFYTNYNSEKGKAIAYNNKVCISFFWPNLERQVIVKGVVEKIDKQASLKYFRSRPRGSQIGALTSNQSEIIESRTELEKKLKSLEDEYHNKEIPMPESWGGYRIQPIEFEFWQGRPNRLHDRIRFFIKNEDWETVRLSP
ncbi:pyridoxamine 5'-phosphate oxidase [Aquimarina algiphila]|uniref:Pyridoxine/pyridoxamine 5'-phosphate oxidase n=1 Tax=Aquimarina algiphila TaxID=2047982 RepID=A0A554VS79_9FLAO|nr:pyridoxamine 5'-phosphate oxidase [Aquimarina algiphila]TSE11512.1 pyridoxamine 5'-phosphate oxidase [Aquimarina algiphila]